jgi:hypothetical protein
LSLIHYLDVNNISKKTEFSKSILFYKYDDEKHFLHFDEFNYYIIFKIKNKYSVIKKGSESDFNFNIIKEKLKDKLLKSSVIFPDMEPLTLSLDLFPSKDIVEMLYQFIQIRKSCVIRKKVNMELFPVDNTSMKLIKTPTRRV